MMTSYGEFSSKMSISMLIKAMLALRNVWEMGKAFSNLHNNCFPKNKSHLE